MSKTVRSSRDFEEWLQSAQPGSRVIYHTGTHAQGVVCRFAMGMASRGLISLVQRRVDAGGARVFQYEAQRTRARYTPREGQS
jgi:hypothetical protein